MSKIMPIPENEFRILSGRFYLETTEGKLSAELTPEGVRIIKGSEDLMRVSLDAIVTSPVITRVRRLRAGESREQQNYYAQRREQDPLFTLLSDRFGSSPEAVTLANALKRSQITSPDDLLMMSEDGIRKIRTIGQKRAQRLIALQRDLRE